MAAADSIPVPQKNVAFRVTFPIHDANGDPVTGAGSLDSEVSKDGAGFSDCTNETTEIGNGLYYLDLTADEMNADSVEVAVKSDQKTTLITIRPEEAGDIRVNATQIEGSDATDQINAACDTALTDYDAVVPADLPTNFADLSITATTGRVDVASIEGSDATDQIRDAVVDDATRIDASALNTASAAVGSDGTGLTEAGGDGDHLTEAGGTGDHLTALPTLTTQLTESYAANGVSPTAAQALFAIHQMLMQFSISGTSISVKKLDNVSAAFTVTLDDASNPTTAERQ